MIKRAFFEVGSGLFSAEQVNNIVTVYDCGGEKDKIPTAINRFQNIFGDHINALFISHYDKDHINGIIELLQHCTVDYLVLPHMAQTIQYQYAIAYITDSILYEHSIDSDTDQYVQFITNPQNFVSEILHQDTIVEFVPVATTQNDENQQKQDPTNHENKRIKEYNEENDPKDRHQPKLRYKLDNAQLTYLFSGQIYPWLYIPHNNHILNTTEELSFFSKLTQITGIKITSVIDIKNNWEAIVKKIKDTLIHSTSTITLANINDYSMTLWSGILRSHCIQRDYCCDICHHCSSRYCHIQYGCLYTGDFNAKKNMKSIHTIYDTYRDYTDILQIPHHGSKYSYHHDLLTMAQRFVISTAHTPKSRQPNPKDVIADIKKTNQKWRTTQHGDVLYYLPSCI